MGDDQSILDELSVEQLKHLAEHLTNRSAALGLAVQGHICSLAEIPDLPLEAKAAAETLAACWNDLMSVSATTLQQIKDEAFGEVN